MPELPPIGDMVELEDTPDLLGELIGVARKIANRDNLTVSVMMTREYISVTISKTDDSAEKYKNDDWEPVS